MLTCLVPVLFTFYKYIQSVLKLKKNNSGAKVLILLNCAVFTQQTNNGYKLLQLVNEPFLQDIIC